MLTHRRSTCRFLPLLVTLATIMCSLPAVAASIAVVATEDGAIQSSGALGLSLDVTDEQIRTIRSGPNNIRHGVYEFDLSVLPAGVLVTAAQLQLEAGGIVSNTSSTSPVRFVSFVGDGAVTLSDFDTPGDEQAQPSFASGASGVKAGDLLAINLLLPEAIQTMAPSGGFLTIRSETFDFVNFRVRSLESSAVGAMRPTLLVTYSVPEPKAAWLFVGGWALVIRRRSVPSRPKKRA